MFRVVVSFQNLVIQEVDIHRDFYRELSVLKHIIIKYFSLLFYIEIRTCLEKFQIQELFGK